VLKIILIIFIRKGLTTHLWVEDKNSIT